jgi:SecY interacting protein Syd
MQRVFMDSLATSLDGFIQAYQDLYLTEKNGLFIQYDEKWLSPCYIEAAQQDQWVNWQPKLRETLGAFQGLEEALEITINPQLVSYYGRYWSDNLNAQSSRGELQLLQVWNQDDFVRLQQNLVAHVLMKRRLKQSETLFFALTDEEDFMICVDNTTGQVVLEQVGLQPKEVLADDLASFITTLKPLCR